MAESGMAVRVYGGLSDTQSIVNENVRVSFTVEGDSGKETVKAVYCEELYSA